MPLNGLSHINVELTSRCNKNCWCCGRRKIDREYPEIVRDYGDMSLSLVESIASQIPNDMLVSLHNNGEPLLYPHLSEALKLFCNNIRQFDTNGKLLLEKMDSLIGIVDIITISVLENDEESDSQFDILKKVKQEFSGHDLPRFVLRLNGDVDSKRYEELAWPIVRRVLHSPMGSFDYKKISPTIPEHHICTEILSHPAVNRHGDVSICVRFDPNRLGVIGNLYDHTLEEIWNSEKRLTWLYKHVRGDRAEVGLCSYCDYWGVPTGVDM